MNYPLNWDLDSLLPDPATAAFREALQKFRDDLTAIANESDKLPPVTAAAPATKTWSAFLERYQQIETRATDLRAFIGCYAAADAANKLYQQIEASLAALEPLRERMLTNVEFGLKGASDADFAAFVKADPKLSQIAFFLQTRRRNATLRLPREQELLAADLAVDGLHAWGRLYDRVSGDLRVKVMERGEVVEKSPSQVRFDVPGRATRENNFYAADKAWSQVADTCADALNHIAGTRLTLYRRLGLRDHLEVPLRFNRMSRETLDAMWSTIASRKQMLQKYCAMKARLLGVEKLSWFDLQAPFPASGSTGRQKINFSDAADQVIETFSGFSPDFGQFARHALQGGWVEAENRSGKRQGAFCTGFPGSKQTRVFMTFTETHDDMSTLAHELGHAYHSHVLRDQPLVLQDYPMNLAETASTFAEAVLAEERLKSSTSTGEQAAILDSMLSDAVTYLMNIHCRFIFENNFHRERAEGELTSQRFSELMESAQREAYLDSLASDGWNPRFWVSKLHFYISGLPFYNFPYTFGYLLSLGVYALARESGGDFAEQYRKLLVATGCQETEDAVQSTLGYDLRGPDFWNKSLDIVEARLERYLATMSAGNGVTV